MNKNIQTSGTRKKAIARSTIKEGNGILKINNKPLTAMTSEFVRLKIEEPLMIAGEIVKKLNIDVDVKGGGDVSQADAVRLAIARGLVVFEPKLKKQFLDYDRTLLVADVRQREARKPNTRGKARQKVQKSYR